MLIAKISFYFESAKKTGEKFREKLGFQNHCPHPYHPPNRYQDTMKGLYAHLSSWHIDPFYFPRKKFFVRKSIKVSFFVAKVRLYN